MIALAALETGLDKIEPDRRAMSDVLDDHWEVLGEALQTVLRKHGTADAYEQIKQRTRGRRMNARDWRELVETAPLPDNEKRRLLDLTPQAYTGIAARLARQHSQS